MTDTMMLKEKIRENGYTITDIASLLGLSYMGFHKKLSNSTEFKASEIATLRKSLKLTAKEANQIFFVKSR